MTDAATAPLAGGTPSLAAQLRRRADLALLAGAAIIGALLAPLVGLVRGVDVLIGSRLSVVDGGWLLIALVLCGIIVRSRSSIRRDLVAAIRQALDRVQLGGAGHAARSTADDFPTLGVRIATGLFDLVIVLVCQGILRAPLVGLISAFLSEAWVDGGYVLLVTFVVLWMFIRLYSSSRPLIERLVWVGLDQLIPTAGFAAGTGAVASPRSALSVATARGATGVPSGAAAARPAAGSADPTVAANPAGSAGDAQATVLAPDAAASAPTMVEERTVVAPDSAGETRFAPIVDEGERTVVAPENDRPVADGATGDAGRSTDATVVADDGARPAPDQTIVSDERPARGSAD